MQLTEKQKNCPYCHEKGGDHRVKAIEDTPYVQVGIERKEDGWHIWAADTLVVGTLRPINYCPMCGRELEHAIN